MTFFTFGDPHEFGLHEAISTDCRSVKRSPPKKKKKKKVTNSLADAHDSTRHRYNYDFTGRCAANGDQPLSCASRQKSLGTTALEFKITIILTPHFVPPTLVFRTPG